MRSKVNNSPVKVTRSPNETKLKLYGPPIVETEPEEIIDKPAVKTKRGKKGKKGKKSGKK